MKHLLIAAAAACFASSAFAHVTLERQEANAGQAYKGVLRVGHGREGTPTTSINVEIPEGIVAVKAMPKTGWKLATEQGSYAQSVQVHGKALASGVRRIVWSGGALPDDQYDEFTFVAQIAPYVAGPVHFPVVQSCEKGEHRWVEIPQTGQSRSDLRAPAAVLRVAASERAAAQHGALRIENSWSRATPGGASVGAGYLTIRNTGTTPERLMGGTTDIAQRIEVHEMSMDNGVMKMRALARGIEIPAGGSVELKPGGFHIMFMGLKSGLKEGASFPATLQFEKAGNVQVQFSVQGMGASSSAPAGGGHGHHHH